MTRRGRPLKSFGSISSAVLSLASDRPVTSLDVARELRLSVSQARFTVSRLRTGGHLQVQSLVRIAGSDKPLHQFVAVRHSPVQADPFSLSAWAHQVRKQQVVEAEA